MLPTRTIISHLTIHIMENLLKNIAFGYIKKTCTVLVSEALLLAPLANCDKAPDFFAVNTFLEIC